MRSFDAKAIRFALALAVRLSALPADDLDRNDVFELHRVPLEGGASVQLNPEFPRVP